MAIARTQKDNISDIEVAKKDTAAGKKDPELKETKTTKKGVDKPEKKPGFFASTVAELKKVDWPGFRHVINWSLTIIVFTIVLSLFLGFADHIFSAGISFANCTSPASGDSRSVQECSDELVTRLTFQN